MVNCPNCGRENAGHFNFCLDCGTELARAPEDEKTSPVAKSLPAAMAASANPVGAVVQPPVSPAAPMPPPAQGWSAPAAPPPAARAPTAAATSAAPTCPICKTPVLGNLKFCGECGAKLDPAAPAPNASSQAAAVAKQTQFLHAADIAALAQPKAKLIVIDPSGKEGMTFSLKAAETICGRVNGIVLFDDPYVSPTHCVFKFSSGRLSVSDPGSLNGVYVRLKAEVELQQGDFIRLGRQLLRFETEASLPRENVNKAADDDSRLWGSPDAQPWGRLVQFLEDGRTGEVRLLKGAEIKLGREVGEVVFNGDGFVSAQHCMLSPRGGRVFLRDMGSSNGTYLRVRGERVLAHDDFVLVGNQMMRVDLR